MRALLRNNVGITPAESQSGALEKLAWSTFDAILVSPDQDDGIELVKAIKRSTRQSERTPTNATLASMRHHAKPLFVVPFVGDDEYAVIVIAPSIAFLDRTTRVPLSRAILHYHFDRLGLGGHGAPGVA